MSKNLVGTMQELEREQFLLYLNHMDFDDLEAVVMTRAAFNSVAPELVLGYVALKVRVYLADVPGVASFFLTDSEPGSDNMIGMGLDEPGQAWLKKWHESGDVRELLASCRRVA